MEMTIRERLARALFIYRHGVDPHTGRKDSVSAEMAVEAAAMEKTSKMMRKDMQKLKDKARENGCLFNGDDLVAYNVPKAAMPQDLEKR